MRLNPNPRDAMPTVLVVDDSPPVLTLIGELLRGSHRVRVAPTGARALELVRAEPPDLVLLDILMPDLDGYEVCRRLKADPKLSEVPVIFLTALDDIDDEARGLDLGAVDYIAKPIVPALLRARVRTHLQLKSTADALKAHSNDLESQVQRRIGEILDTQDVTINLLAALAEARDNETGNHILRTQRYVRALAEVLAENPRHAEQLDRATIELLYKSAPLHDIGKVGIPDAILLKPGKLTHAEFEIMKTHTTLGHDALCSAERRLGKPAPFLRYAKEIALSHQEKWDGSGYPHGLSGEDIPLSARLMAVADVYDALISRRVYKEAMSHEAASTLVVQGSGSHFDPAVIDVFVRINHVFRDIASQFADQADEAGLAGLAGVAEVAGAPTTTLHLVR
jgi:putative two-component system response regulator